MPNHEISEPLDSEQITYYDLMAILCWKIDQLPEETSGRLYQMISNGLDKYMLNAKKKYPELLKLSNRPDPLYCNLDGKRKQQLLDLVKHTEETELENLAILVGAIAAIDNLMEHLGNIPAFLKDKGCIVHTQEAEYVSNSVFSFKALNTCTHQHFGVVIPRFICVWERKRDRSLATVAFRPLSLVLKNHIWFSNQEQWDITNLYLDIRATGLYPERIKKLSEFRVISSPLCNVAPFTTDLNKKDMKLYIRYHPEENGRILDAVKKTIDQGISWNADIVLFPEMMGSDSVIEACETYISALNIRTKPKLYFLPTTEKKCDGQWQNTLRILDQDGGCVFEYHKQHPFQYDKKVKTGDDTLEVSKESYFKEKTGDDTLEVPKESYFEPIQADNRVCVIHVPGIGRIGMMVCSDIFRENYLNNLINRFQLTLLLYPVFSDGKDLLERMVSLTRTFSCDAVLCNTCAAWQNTLVPPSERPVNCQFDHNMVNVYYPNGHKYEPSARHQPACDGNTCNGCCFQTRLTRDYLGKTETSKQFEFEM